jgi:glycosyltransferase involved in cell wall biosynthesis
VSHPLLSNFSPPPRRVFLGSVGDVNNRDTFSGTPYHFLQAAKRAGFIDEGLALHSSGPDVKRRRWIWNGLHVLSGHTPGGYQYSDRFLDRMWKPAFQTLRGNAVINQFQLYPLRLIREPSITKWYYIDGTLKQLFDYYGVNLDRRYRIRILQRETLGYRSAQGIATLSAFAAKSVIADYGIPASKVHVIVPGANITADEIAACRATLTPRRPGDPLRLLCVGKDWQRKGLDRLLRALRLAQARGLRAGLRVIGCARDTLPPELRDTPNVEWCGFISRQKEGPKLLRLLAECDVGCLLSRAEFSSIALREYLALGMVVLGPQTGGCGDLMEPEASIAVTPDAPDERIAEILLSFEQDPALFQKLRAAAERLRPTALWEESVRKFLKIWPIRE